MDKFRSFFTTTSPLLLILMGIGIEISAKFIEKRFANFAMGLQLITFLLFFYAMIKFFNSKLK